VNFFESQDRVHRNTTWLVVLFSFAVISLIVMTNLLVMMVLVISTLSRWLVAECRPRKWTGRFSLPLAQLW